MKIAIDVSPLQTGHRIRGIGFYVENLKASILKYYPENDYIFFSKTSEIPKDVDLVHYPYFDPFFITLPLIKKHRTVVTVHDLTPLVFPAHFPSGAKGKLKWQIQKNTLKKTDAIITDSESSKSDIAKYTGFPQNKIDTVYLAAGEEFHVLKPTAKSQELIAKYKLPEKFVLYVGDVTWNKNLPRLIKAINLTKIPLVMVGAALVNKNFDKNNPWNQDLLLTQELITNNPNIKTLGFVPTEDLVVLYNLATIFTMPSLYEGFGLPILEAMQSGCPVITSKTGSLSEVAGKAAYYVDAKSIDNISRGISEVFESEKTQTKLTEIGLSQAKKFTWQKAAAQTIEAYKKVLNQ